MALAYNFPGMLRNPFDTKDFTYTGESIYVNDKGGNWRLKFLSSGIFTPSKDVVVDIFAVGGGGGGSGGVYTKYQTIYTSAGGGGGHTKTVTSQSLTAGTAYTITVGSGGTGGANNGGAAKDGSASSFATLCTANGGGGAKTKSGDYMKGGNGGSGGAGAMNYKTGTEGTDYVIDSTGYSGGYDGSDGKGVRLNGTGQGTTTREFGESSGELYAGGGGNGAVMKYENSEWRIAAMVTLGGEGGGGSGRILYIHNGVPSYSEANGWTSTGGGGGGGLTSNGNADSSFTTAAASAVGGAGGSGIVIIRNAREQ